MRVSSWRKWLHRTFGLSRTAPIRRPIPPRLERLEDRWVPAISATAQGALTFVEGASNTLQVANFTTTTPGDNFTASIDWGDGTIDTGTAQGVNVAVNFTAATPVQLLSSGFNQDVVYEAGRATPTVTQSFDQASHAFFQSGAVDNTGTPQNAGLQTTFTSNQGTPFTFQDFGANNVLLLGPGNGNARTGTLTLGTPASYGGLAILATSADIGGSATGTFTINFSNGTSSNPINFDATDWSTTDANAVFPTGSVLNATSSGGAFTGTDFSVQMFETDVDLTALGLSGKTIDSITFNAPSGSTGETGIFAVSATNGFVVKGSHTYADEGTFSPVVTITEAGAGAPPDTVAVTDTATVAEGDTLTGSSGIGLVTEGPVNTVPFTFTDSLKTNTASDFTATIDWGDGTSSTGAAVTITNTGGSYTVSASHAYADEGTFTATATLTDDAAGTASATSTLTITASEGDTLTGTGLSFSALESPNSFSGDVATFSDSNSSAEASDFTATINWGDGSPTTTGTVTGTTGGPFTVSDSHTYAEDGTFNPVVTLTDDAPGSASATATGAATVNESSLGITGVGTITTTEGATFSGTVATASDPGSPDLGSDFTATIDWGDGTTDTVTPTGSAGTYTISGSHSYTDEGSFTANVTFFENNDPTFTVSQTDAVTVAEGDTLTGTPAAVSTTEGTAFTDVPVATFTDTNTSNTADDFTATIDWGDGMPIDTVTPTGGSGTFTVSGSHTYDEGTFTVTITLTDDAPGTASATASLLATVNDADALAAAGTQPTISATEGTSFSGPVAVFTNTGYPTNDPADFTATIDWGDGATGDTGAVSSDGLGAFTVSGTHTYKDEGSFTVKVILTDEGGAAAATGFYGQTNLVSDLPGTAVTTDPSLINPWGIAFSPTSPFWIADNGTGLATLYNGSGVKQGLVVTIPLPSSSPFSHSAPTGTVFNSTASDFVLPTGGKALFLFATEDGTLAAWNGAQGTTALLVASPPTLPVYKGLALANNGTANFLYATDFHNGAVDVFDANFNLVTPPGGFVDPNLPAGYAPFGIQNIGGNLYVTYALQDAAKHDDVAGPGHGLVDEFDANGSLIRRFASFGTLNSPWGMALAPATFGSFAGDLLIGNFGDGHISAFNPVTGAFLGQLSAAPNRPVTIDGLWGLAFGNGGAGFNPNNLYFTAGLNDEADGLFGSLSVVPANIATVAEADTLAAASVQPNATLTEGDATTSGNVAVFSDTGYPTNSPLDFTATIDWGDGSPLDTGMVSTAGDGNFTVSGSHAYADEGAFTATVTLSDDAPGTATATATSIVTVVEGDTLSGTVTAAGATEGAAFSGQVATFTDTYAGSPAADFTATIDWGDGTTPTAGTVTGGAGAFTVSGSHTYADEGAFPVAVTLTENAPGSASATAVGTANVAEADVLSGTASPIQATEGTAVTEIATFTDTYTGNTAADFTATINWGDGTTTTGAVSGGSGAFTVSGGHTYTASGSFTVSVTLQDDAPGTAFAVASTTASVSGDIVVPGTSADDVLTVFRTPGGGVGDITYVLNGGPPVTLTGVHSFTFDGLAGDDTMNVEFANGEPLVPAGVAFDGGTGVNTLTVDAAGLPVRTIPGALTVGDPQTVGYVNVQTTNIDNAAAVEGDDGPDTADRATAFIGLSANERFVQAVYLDELGRAGTTAELDGWAAAFNSGLSQSQAQAAIAGGVQHSLEARDHLVSSWYIAFLGRQADGTEDQGFVNALGAGQSEEQVLSLILGSPEFYNRAQTLIPTGSADERYVQALYLLLLDRTGEASAVAGWVGGLGAVGRQGVALGFLDSQEFRTDQFEGYYNALLHRPDDPVGLNAFVMSNLDIGSVRVAFESSLEFFVDG